MAKRLKDVGAFIEDDLEDDQTRAGEDKPKKRKQVTDVVAPEFEASRLHHGQLEFMTLVRCVMDEALRGRLWPRLVEDHFASDTALSIYRRLRTLSQLGKDWPSLGALAMDPAIDKAAQAQLGAMVARAEKGHDIWTSIELSNGQQVPLESASDFEGYVFDILEASRVTRTGLGHMVETVSSVADSEEFDPLAGPELVERAASEILAIRGQESIADSLLHFGVGLTEEDDKKRQAELKKLSMKDKPRFKIGLSEYDRRAGGFQGGEVVLLGANTGGGKTAFQITCMTNMARMGTSAAMLQLELSLEQMDERLGSHLARIDSNFIRSGNIDPKHQAQIAAAWDEFHEECIDAGSRFTVYAPSSQTIAGCEMVFKQFPYKVWFIDYVNLLNLDGDAAKLDGWQKLSFITKAFKALAKKYNICIVLGVQVNIDSDGNIEIRYAKAMKEDADIALVWYMNDDAKADKAVFIKHLKARQYEPFDFEVAAYLEYGSFEDLIQTRRKKKRTLGKKKVHQKDEVDQVIEKGGFKKKDKPLVVEDDKPIMEAALAGDLATKLKERTALEVDEDEVYDDFDEE